MYIHTYLFALTLTYTRKHKQKHTNSHILINRFVHLLLHAYALSFGKKKFVYRGNTKACLRCNRQCSKDLVRKEAKKFGKIGNRNRNKKSTMRPMGQI